MGVVVMPPRSGTSGSRIRPAWPLASAGSSDREPDLEQEVADERREQRHPERDELLGVVGVGHRLVCRGCLLVEADDGDPVDADGLEELGAVAGDPVEEEVVRAPPVDAGEQRRRVGEDLADTSKRRRFWTKPGRVGVAGWYSRSMTPRAASTLNTVGTAIVR